MTRETKISVDSDRFVDLVAAKAAHDVHERLTKSNVGRIASARNITFALGLLAVGSLGALYYFERQARLTENDTLVAQIAKNALASPAIKAQFDQAVDDAVRGAIDNKLIAMSAQIEGLAAYQHLVTLAMQLEVKEAFSNDDRNEILGLLEKLKTLGGYMERPGFKRHLSKIIDSFTSAYQVSAIDRLDDLFRDDLAGMDDVPRWLTNHFGRVFVTSNDISDKGSRRSERLKFYADVAKQNQNPEVSLLWDLISQFVIAGELRTPKVDSVFAQVEFLSEEERALFGRALLEEATASERDPADLRRLALVATNIVQAYKQELSALGIDIE